MNNDLNAERSECQFIMNPVFEFIEDDNGLVVFDENVGNIYRTNTVGKKIIVIFNTPITIKDAIDALYDIFDGIVLSELESYITHLVEEKIIVPS